MNSLKPPCLSDCSAQELSQYLLQRFKNDSTKTATFLLESLDNIPNIEEINDNLNQESDRVEEERSRNILGTQIQSLPQINESNDSSSSSSVTVSAVVPRSKFTLSMYEKGCIMTNNKNEQILLHCNDIKHVIVFPKREDCVKTPKLSKTAKNNVEIPGSMILALLEEGKVNFRNKPLKQICFQLPQHWSQSTHEPNKGSLERSNIIDDFETKWVNLLESSLGNKIVRVYNPRFNQIAISLNKFQSDEGNPDSSMIQGGMPYVKCYKGVNDGVLYPLDAGLLFYKPPLFIHRSQLHSIACGRGPGGSSRFADLVVTLDEQKDQPLEFTNIDKEEVEGLNDYINNTLVKAMTEDINGEETLDNESESDGTDDHMSEPSRKRKSQRSASAHARKATKVQLQSSPTVTEDSEEDDDYSQAPSESDEELFEDDNTDKQQEYEDGSDTESEDE